MRSVVVNSTVRAYRSRISESGEEISPLHYWGYEPQANDYLLGHRQTRFEILLRHYITGGVDPCVFLKTIFGLVRGSRALYLVTQPDLIKTLPLLRRLFPRIAIITWVWTAREAIQWNRYLMHCSHILALTEPAKYQLSLLGLGERSSLAIWGCDPHYYTQGYSHESQQQVTTEAIFIGLTKRDLELVRCAALDGRFQVRVGQKSFSLLGALPNTVICNLNSRKGLLDALYGSNVSLIPLLPGEPDPAGYTNLVESLLCGTAVVIADSSTIPEVVLSLPGVYRYRTSDPSSFLDTLALAVRESAVDGRRIHIRTCAAGLLNGSRLRSIVASTMKCGALHLFNS